MISSWRSRSTYIHDLDVGGERDRSPPFLGHPEELFRADAGAVYYLLMDIVEQRVSMR
jgi:hypothetical protein